MSHFDLEEIYRRSKCVPSLLALVAFLSGCAAPSGLPQKAHHQAVDASAAAKREGEVMNFPVSWSAPDRVAVPMKLRNGLPTIACAVNGHEVWMIVDTGSQKCVLEAATATKAGVRTLHRSVAKVEVTGGRGKESALVGVPETFSAGAWTWRGLPCVVRTPPSPASKRPPFSRTQVAFNILGMDVLESMCSYVAIDYPRREVVFGFRKAFQPANPAAAHQSFETRAGVPYIRLSHAGEKWWSLFDTGASSSMEITQATARRFAGKQRTRWIDTVHYGLGGEPVRRRLECLTLASVHCLGRDWRNVEAMLVENESKVGSGLVPAFRLTLDFARSRLWLEAPGRRAQ